jgi:hypothetical protein
MMQNNLREPPKKKWKVSKIETNEELKQMFKVAVDKNKYSDSDIKYLLKLSLTIIPFSFTCLGYPLGIFYI